MNKSSDLMKTNVNSKEKSDRRSFLFTYSLIALGALSALEPLAALAVDAFLFFVAPLGSDIPTAASEIASAPGVHERRRSGPAALLGPSTSSHSRAQRPD
jgi:hypothetical protein